MFPLFGILTPAVGPAAASDEAPFKKSFFGGANADRETGHVETLESRRDLPKDGSVAPGETRLFRAARER